MPGYGTVIQLKFVHGQNTYGALYAHLSATWVYEKQMVDQGVVLGYTGNSGNAKGEPPHLHFEIATDYHLNKGRRNQIDPSAVLGTFLNDHAAGQGVYRESDFDLNLDAYTVLSRTA